MVKRSAQKQRGRNERSTKRFILIGTEGKNKTEIGYFNQFNRIEEFSCPIFFGQFDRFYGDSGGHKKEQGRSGL